MAERLSLFQGVAEKWLVEEDQPRLQTAVARPKRAQSAIKGSDLNKYLAERGSAYKTLADLMVRVLNMNVITRCFNVSVTERGLNHKLSGS